MVRAVQEATANPDRLVAPLSAASAWYGTPNFAAQLGIIDFRKQYLVIIRIGATDVVDSNP